MKESALALLAAGAVLAIGVPLVTWQATRPDNAPVVEPSPSPTLPPYYHTDRLLVDGQTYNCVVYAGKGLSCDWDHPLIAPTSIEPSRSLSAVR